MEFIVLARDHILTLKAMKMTCSNVQYAKIGII